MPDTFYIYVSLICFFGILVSPLYEKIERVSEILWDQTPFTSPAEDISEFLRSSPLIESSDESPKYTERLS